MECGLLIRGAEFVSLRLLHFDSFSAATARDGLFFIQIDVNGCERDVGVGSGEKGDLDIAEASDGTQVKSARHRMQRKL